MSRKLTVKGLFFRIDQFWCNYRANRITELLLKTSFQLKYDMTFPYQE